jgi:hypothetical protein
VYVRKEYFTDIEAGTRGPEGGEATGSSSDYPDLEGIDSGKAENSHLHGPTDV